MMTDMMPGMMWGMALLWLLVAIALILATAALVEYLRSGDKAAPR
jgi:tellurite resistance protein TehA-like permease